MNRSFVFKTCTALAVTVACVPWVLASSASSAISPASSDIHISADKQTYNLERKRYFLSGKVVVTYQDMRITGPKAEVEMDEAGKPQVAHFYNRPLFVRIKPKVGEDRVVGDLIKVYLSEDRYGAQGNVESKIVTVAADPFLIRSDVQEFDHKNKVVSASGNVQVNYQGSQAYSPLANVRMKDDGKAERVIFSGGARIVKPDSEINGDRITVMVDSGNLIAEHNVKTRVDLKKKNPPAAESVSGAKSASTTVMNAKAPIAAPGATATEAQPEKVLITSDYQQYDKASDTMLASGNVTIIYGDYVAVGPKATFKLRNNDLDRIFLTGRPTITDNGRTVTADKITITTNPKNFDAVGNVKVKFKTADKTQSTPAVPEKKSGKLLPKDEPSDY